MIGHFVDDELRKIDVIQNSETIYYPIDDDGKYIGVNKLSGENLLVLLKDNDIETITFINSPEGLLTPMNEINPKEVVLKGFNWRITEQPQSMFDVFIW